LLQSAIDYLNRFAQTQPSSADSSESPC
jgi:hypothetical protein